MDIYDILLGNTHIADLVGFESRGNGYFGEVPDNPKFKVYYDLKSLRFHSDWNWIKYAIKKLLENPRSSVDQIRRVKAAFLTLDETRVFKVLVDIAKELKLINLKHG